MDPMREAVNESMIYPNVLRSPTLLHTPPPPQLLLASIAYDATPESPEAVVVSSGKLAC